MFAGLTAVAKCNGGGVSHKKALHLSLPAGVGEGERGQDGGGGGGGGGYDRVRRSTDSNVRNILC